MNRQPKWESDGTAVETLRLNPHPRLRRECGTLKIKGVGSGDLKGLATRPK